MTYQSRADLSQDASFRERATACAQEQALTFKDDGRADIAALAHAVIQSSSNAAPVVDLVALAPNFVDVTDPAEVTDADILAATQQAWLVYAAVAYPAPPAP